MTTKEMIAVMTAFEEGKEIERKLISHVSYLAINGVRHQRFGVWEDDLFPNWDWNNYEYRIKPEEPKKESNNICGCSCRDNRFEIIKKAKQHLLESTNISSSDDEMKVLDTFLFRCWQMGWLKIYEGQSETIESAEKRNQLDKPEEPKPKYRPYANAEELDEAIKEHGMWIKCETTGTRMVISCYNDNRINYVDKDTIFNTYTWLDGTPFGIKE